MSDARTTLPALYQSVTEYAQDCFDTQAELSKLYFSNGNGMQVSAPGNGLFTAPVALQGTLNNWALSQVAARLDAPTLRWLGDDTHCSPATRSALLNLLVAERDNAKLLVRSKGDTFRAVLSSEYTPFDNKELMEYILEASQQLGTEIQVMRPEVGDELRAYLLLPQITFGAEPTAHPSTPSTPTATPTMTPPSNFDPHGYGNGGLHPALYINNSERGDGCARIVGAVYRGSCGNGMIYGFSQQQTFAIRHRWVTHNIMATLVADSIAQALKMSEYAAQLFMASQERKLQPSQLKGLLGEWSARYGISLEAKENWLQAVTYNAMDYGRAQEPTLFDVVNGLTFAAQQRGSDERELMERVSGDMLASIH